MPVPSGDQPLVDAGSRAAHARARLAREKQRGFRKADELARLTFLGASGEVTGSSYLLETASARVLFDCGTAHGRSRRTTPRLEFRHR